MNGLQRTIADIAGPNVGNILKYSYVWTITWKRAHRSVLFELQVISRFNRAQADLFFTNIGMIYM